MIKSINVQDKNDELHGTSVYSAINGKKLTYTNGTLGNGNYTYDDSKKLFRIKTDNRGYFRIYLGKVNVGDKVKVSCESRTLNGNFNHISIDVGVNGYGSDGGTSNPYSNSELNQWEKLGFTYVVKNIGMASCVVGLSTNESGTVEFRNLKIDIETTVNDYMTNITPFKRVCSVVLKKVGGNFVANQNSVPFNNNDVIITKNDDYTIEVKFSDLTNDNQFNYDSPNQCVGFATNEFNEYLVRSGSNGIDKINIGFYNATTGARLKISDLAEGTGTTVFAFK